MKVGFHRVTNASTGYMEITPSHWINRIYLLSTL